MGGWLMFGRREFQGREDGEHDFCVGIDPEVRSSAAFTAA